MYLGRKIVVIFPSLLHHYYLYDGCVAYPAGIGVPSMHHQHYNTHTFRVVARSKMSVSEMVGT